MAKKEEAYMSALEGKSIPILTLDNKWHQLFTQTDMTPEIEALADELNALVEKDGKPCLNTNVYDEVFRAANQDAFDTAKLLAKKEGISVGISSGAALFGAIQLAKRPENKGKVIVALLPDSGDRYYSTPLFTE